MSDERRPSEAAWRLSDDLGLAATRGPWPPAGWQQRVIQSALDAAAAEAYERAAQEVEKWHEIITGENLAAAIRALAKKESER